MRWMTLVVVLTFLSLDWSIVVAIFFLYSRDRIVRTFIMYSISIRCRDSCSFPLILDEYCSHRFTHTHTHAYSLFYMYYTFFWVNLEKKTNCRYRYTRDVRSFIHSHFTVNNSTSSNYSSLYKNVSVCEEEYSVECRYIGMAFMWHENGENDVQMRAVAVAETTLFSTVLRRCLFEEKLFAISKLNYSEILSLSLFFYACLFVSIVDMLVCPRARALNFPCFPCAVYMVAFLVICLSSICWHRCRYSMFFVPFSLCCFFCCCHILIPSLAPLVILYIANNVTRDVHSSFSI